MKIAKAIGLVALLGFITVSCKRAPNTTSNREIPRTSSTILEPPKPTLTGLTLPFNFSYQGLDITFNSIEVSAPTGGSSGNVIAGAPPEQQRWVMLNFLVNERAGSSMTVPIKEFVDAVSANGSRLSSPSFVAPTNNISGMIGPHEVQPWKVAYQPTTSDFPIQFTLASGNSFQIILSSGPSKINP